MDDVARFLGVPKWRLTRQLYNAPESARYGSFEIPKRTGGMRRIDSPRGLTREAQYKLLPILIERHRAHPASHGFLAERTIVTNAALHADQRLVLNVDLADFFPSVNFGRVRGLFMAKPFEMAPPAATVCAQICTFRNGLPQGAPTSPILSNFIASELDRRLSRLARENGLRYSRYADDITFSTGRPLFPANIARLLGEGPQNGVEVGDALEAAIGASGFAVNHAKVRLQSRHVRQAVTGLTVNAKPNVTRRRVRRLRAMLHAWETFGLEAAGREHFRRYARAATPQSFGAPDRAYRNAVYGELAFLKMVRGVDDPLFRKFCGRAATLDPNPPKMLRQVVFGADDFDIFISHASEDKEAVARPIFEACQRLGIKAFLDQDHIEWGENFTQKINIALGAARLALLVVTPTSVTKPWPLAEMNAALNLEVTGEKIVTPLMVGQPDLSALPLLKGKDWMVWSDDPMAVARRLKSELDRRAAPPEPKSPATRRDGPWSARRDARRDEPTERKSWLRRFLKR